MNDKPCCQSCKGPAPHHFCQNKYVSFLQQGCKCHQRQDRLAHLKQAQLYRDPTPSKAIGNVMKGETK